VRGQLRPAPSEHGHAVTAARRARVLLADDHRLVAEGLKGLLEAEFELVAMVEDGRAMVAAARALRPDVVVADISMPELNGIDALVELRRVDAQARVVFLTMHRDPVYARRALDAGASGYVLKHSAPGELIAAIRAALAGRTFVSPLLAKLVRSLRHGGAGVRDPVAALPLRQREVLQLLAEGKSAKEIGASLAISARTVEFHKYQAMETLGLHTSAELIHFAIKQGLVQI